MKYKDPIFLSDVSVHLRHGVGNKKIEIEISDNISGSCILEVEIPEDSLYEFITGLRGGNSHCKATIFSQDNLGKYKISKPLEFEVSGSVCGSNIKEVAKSRAITYCDEGWEPVNYYDSKDSIKGGFGSNYIVKTRQIKYVSKEEFDDFIGQE